MARASVYPSNSGHLRHGLGLIFIKSPQKSYPAGIFRKTLELGNCGKNDDPNSVLTSSVNRREPGVNHLGHVTSKIFGKKGEYKMK